MIRTWIWLLAVTNHAPIDWNGILTALATGLGGVAAGTVGGYFLLRTKKVEQQSEESKSQATATSAFLEGQKAFQEYVDGVVDERVQKAVAEFEERLNELQTSFDGLRRESHEMNDAYRTFTTQLWLWNVRGRVGPIPELPVHILQRLGLIHLSTLGDLEDTEPIHPKGTPS